MWLSKFKSIAVILLALGMLSAGGGAVAFQLFAANPSGASPEEQRPSRPLAGDEKAIPQPEGSEKLDGVQQERQRLVELERAREEYRRRKDELRAQEDAWTEELHQIRRSIDSLEESLMVQAKREQALNQQVQALQLADQNLKQALVFVAEGAANEAGIKELEVLSKEIQQQIENTRAGITKEANRKRASLGQAKAASGDLRKEIRQHQQQLWLSDDEIRRKRERLQQRADAAEDRVRDLEVGAASTNAPVLSNAVERQLHRLIQEVSELRRELRQQPAPRRPDNH